MRNRNFEHGGSRKNGTRRVRKFWVICAWVLSISMILGTGNFSSYIVDADDGDVQITEVPSETAETETQESAAPVLSATPEPVNTETYVPETTPEATPSAVPSPSIAPVSEATTEPAASVSPEASPSATPYASMEPTASTELSAAPETAAPASMPAVSFEDTEETTGIKVSVKAEEGTFPEGTTMELSPVTDTAVLNDAMQASSLEHAEAKAVDITFKDAAQNIIEPKKQIRVTMTADVIKDADTVDVVHVPDEAEKEENQSVQTAVVNQTADADLEENEKPAENQVVFDADQFSVYAIVYTVDFTYDGFSYTLTGNESVLLSELAQQLNLSASNSENPFDLSKVTDVSFSNPELVSITKQDNGDYLLQSLQPFSTEETLTITTGNTSYAVKVTDDQNSAKDLTEYIKTVVTEKLNQSKDWESAKEFTDGDSARIRIYFQLPDNVATADNRVMTYQLPNGITITENLMGDILNPSGGSIGRYSIETNGKITFTFFEETCKDGKGFDFDIQFESTVTKSAENQDGTIQFGKSGTKITVKGRNQTNDISTAKNGVLNPDGSISYTIVVSTTNGTGENVKVVDQYSDDNNDLRQPFEYDLSNLAVQKISADGISTQSITLTEDQIKKNNASENSKPSFEISDLPPLNRGEKYKISYNVKNISVKDKNKISVVKNSATSYSGNTYYTGSSEVRIFPAAQKSGYYNSDSNLIYWQIVLNESRTGDVSNWSIDDETPGEIVGDVEISKGNSWNQVGKFTPEDKNKLSFKLSDKYSMSDEDKNEVYYITYSTKAPCGNPGEKFQQKNTVNIHDGNDQIGSSTGIVNGIERNWSVQKSSTNTDTSDIENGILKPQWKFEIVIPGGNVDSFTYTDQLGKVTDGNGTEVSNAKHFAVASVLDQELKTNLNLILSSGMTVNFNNSADNNIRFSIKYYDDNGEVDIANNPKAHITKFEITVSSTSGGGSFQADKLSSIYSTVVSDVSSMKQMETWKTSNTGSIPSNGSSTGEWSYTRPKKFEKQVWTGNDGYRSGTNVIDYSNLSDGILKYRLMLSTSSSDNGKDIVIEDKLPEGSTFDETTLKVGFYQDEYTTHTTNYFNTDFTSSDQKPRVEVKPEGSNTKLTITLPKYGYVSGYPNIAITYDVSIKDDPSWSSNLALSEKKYINSANWGTDGSSTETTIKRTRDMVLKSGAQLVTETGKPYGRLRYQVVINPAGSDLDPDSSTLTLEDKLNGDNLSSLNPKLDISSVHLYNFDSKKSDQLGTELPETSYSLDYDESSSMSLVVPDGKPLVLVYEYTLDENYSDGKNISNSVTLNGRWNSEQSTELHVDKSSSHGYKSKITIYKVDSRNNKITLPGTEFKLEKYDKDSKEWVAVKDKLIVNSEGKLEWNLSGSNPELENDVLYKLIETHALDGYTLDDTPHYFIWNDAKNNDQNSYEKALEGADSKDKIEKSKITFFANAGGTSYIKNTYSRVGVKKVWTLSDGSVMRETPSDTSVTVQLFQEKQEKDGYTVTTTIESKSNPGAINTNSLIVKAEGSLTISFSEWEDQNSTINISDNDTHEQYQMNFSSGVFSYTFSSINRNLNLTIECTPYNPPEIQYSNYINAPYKLIAKTEYLDPVALDSSNGWSYSWDNLPQSDGNGHALYYSVEETSVTKDNTDKKDDYITTYSNNEGIQTGHIIITNTPKETYQLPETGGSGISFIIGRGIGLIAVALAGWMIKRKQSFLRGN